MRDLVTMAAGGVLLVYLAGCGGKAKPEAPPAPTARTICFEAGPRLNWHADGTEPPTAHTLFVRLYQLSSLDGFHRADPAKLLSGETPLLGAEGPVVDRTLHPGRKTSVEVRVLPNTQALGIVGGYFKLEGAGKVVRRLAAKAKAEDDGEDDDDEETKADEGPAESTDACVFFDANQMYDTAPAPATAKKPKAE